MAAFNYRDLIRLVPVSHWQLYCDSRCVEIPQSKPWDDTDEAQKQADIKAAIEALEGEQREKIYGELRQVLAMAKPQGMRALYNAVERWDGAVRQWEQMVSDAQRMLDALVCRPEALQTAQAILQADEQIGRKLWARLFISEGERMDISKEAVGALEKAISDSFTQPKAKPRACEIDVLNRHLDGSIQLDIRLEADQQRNLEFAEDNRTHWRDVRPTKPMTIIYHPVAGVLDMLVPGGKKARDKILPALGEHLFGKALQSLEKQAPLFLLNHLLQGLHPPSDSGLDLMSYGVSSVGLTHCRFKAQVEPALDIELRTKPKATDVLKAIELRGLQALVGTGYTLDQATVSLHFEAGPKTKARILHMHLRPTGINNRSDMDEGDVLLCERLLQALGVMEQLPEPEAEDDAMGSALSESESIAAV